MIRKNMLTLLCCAALACSLTGCDSTTGSPEEEQGYHIWFINETGDELVKEVCSTNSANESEQLDAFLNQFRKAPDGHTCSSLLPPEVSINSANITGKLITLDFSGTYEEMDPIREVLARAGMVRALVQLPGVSEVRFTMDGRDAVTPGGKTLGVMSENSFIEGAGKQINATQHTTINLYFADEGGQQLKRESRSIYYSANKTLEWAIVERIIAGPKQAGSYSTVPSTTQIISVTSANGVCYVNLTQAFLNNTLGIGDTIPIYSIVNSIVDNSRDITTVQISIEGDSDILFRQTVSLHAAFEPEFGLVVP